tara:strand:- start:2566 stop:3129 length:564 start_codon:yes stop_codon:yes gene_type:complete
LTEGTELSARPTDKVGRVLFQITRALALLGGLVVCAMAILTIVSVSGRAVIATPVPGDIEMVAIGTSTAVFSFLPYCQLMRGNVIVDFFMTKAPTRAKTFFDAIGSLIFLSVGAILTWRLIFGAMDMYNYGEKTMTVGFPRWVTFPYALVCMSILLVVIVYTLGRSIAETRANRFFDEHSFDEHSLE